MQTLDIDCLKILIKFKDTNNFLLINTGKQI